MAFEAPNAVNPTSELGATIASLASMRKWEFLVGQGSTVMYSREQGCFSLSGATGTSARGSSAVFGTPYQLHSTSDVDNGTCYHFPRWSTHASGITDAVVPSRPTAALFLFNHDETGSAWTEDYTSLRFFAGYMEVSSSGNAPTEVVKSLSGIVADGRSCAGVYFDTDAADTRFSCVTSSGSASTQTNLSMSEAPQAATYYAALVDARTSGEITVRIYDRDVNELGSATNTTNLPTENMALAISTITLAASNDVRQINFGTNFYFD